MNKNSKIFIAGSRGLVGGAIAKALLKNGYTNQIEVPILNWIYVNKMLYVLFLRQKNRNMYFSQRVRLVGYMLMQRTPHNSFTTIS